MNWDLVILMKQALDEINKLSKFDDEEATKTLDDKTYEDKYLKNDLSLINKIRVSDSISRSQFDKWKKETTETQRDGMYRVGHAISIDLDSESNSRMGRAKFIISYPVVDGIVKKLLEKLL